jgi:large subunit ribosomal protein L18
MKNIMFRRKREGKTNYKKRLSLLLNKKPRIVVRFSLKNITVQIIEYQEEGDKIIVSANSKELEKTHGWKFSRNNIPAAYLTGYLLSKKAIKKEVKEAILDIGLKTSIKGGKIYAVLKGILDGGIKVPHSKEMLPSEEAIKGTHILNYSQKLLKEGKYEKVFSDYAKKGIKLEELPKQFEEIKKKID